MSKASRTTSTKHNKRSAGQLADSDDGGSSDADMPGVRRLSAPPPKKAKPTVARAKKQTAPAKTKADKAPVRPVRKQPVSTRLDDEDDMSDSETEPRRQAADSEHTSKTTKGRAKIKPDRTRAAQPKQSEDEEEEEEEDDGEQREQQQDLIPVKRAKVIPKSAAKAPAGTGTRRKVAAKAPKARAKKATGGGKAKTRLPVGGDDLADGERDGHAAEEPSTEEDDLYSSDEAESGLNDERLSTDELEQEKKEANRRICRSAKRITKENKKRAKEDVYRNAPPWKKADILLADSASIRARHAGLLRKSLQDGHSLAFAIPSLKSSGQEKLNEALALIATLSPQDSEKLWAVNARNRGVTVFEDLRSMKDEKTAILRQQIREEMERDYGERLEKELREEMEPKIRERLRVELERELRHKISEEMHGKADEIDSALSVSNSALTSTDVNADSELVPVPDPSGGGSATDLVDVATTDRQDGAATSGTQSALPVSEQGSAAASGASVDDGVAKEHSAVDEHSDHSTDTAADAADGTQSQQMSAAAASAVDGSSTDRREASQENAQQEE